VFLDAMEAEFSGPECQRHDADVKKAKLDRLKKAGKPQQVRAS